VDQVEPDSLTRQQVFNIGVTQTDLQQAELFYTSLGFEPLSRAFLPRVLPLKERGAAMLILHGSATKQATPKSRNIRVVLETEKRGGCGNSDSCLRWI
jgi:hypothetical protein